MDFKGRNAIEGCGVALGYVFSYFLFATILFFILLFLKKISGDWSYLYAMAITAALSLAGFLAGRLLR